MIWVGWPLERSISVCPGLFAMGYSPGAQADEKLGNRWHDTGIQQRNGRKTLTTVQGLDKAYDPKKILKAFKKVSPS